MRVLNKRVAEGGANLFVRVARDVGALIEKRDHHAEHLQRRDWAAHECARRFRADRRCPRWRNRRLEWARPECVEETMALTVRMPSAGGVSITM